MDVPSGQARVSFVDHNFFTRNLEDLSNHLTERSELPFALGPPFVDVVNSGLASEQFPDPPP
jgi:hypothetical protein